MKLEGKVCLVTGGTKGIGAEAAVALAGLGADVAIIGRHKDEEAVKTGSRVEKAGRKCLIITADMGKGEDAERCVRETAEKFGTVDVLVHSAGGLVAGGLLEISPEAWHAGFDVHVHAIYYLCRAAVPLMQKNQEGVIILVSSVAGLRGVKTHVAYQAVKGALPQLTRALAYEFSEDNIRVNCVAPGIIRTRFHANMPPEQKQHNLENRIPLHREGKPEDVATLVCELVTNDYISGETVVIDGGLSMRIA